MKNTPYFVFTLHLNLKYIYLLPNVFQLKTFPINIFLEFEFQINWINIWSKNRSNLNTNWKSLFRWNCKTKQNKIIYRFCTLIAITRCCAIRRLLRKQDIRHWVDSRKVSSDSGAEHWKSYRSLRYVASVLPMRCSDSINPRIYIMNIYSAKVLFLEQNCERFQRLRANIIQQWLSSGTYLCSRIYNLTHIFQIDLYCSRLLS